MITITSSTAFTLYLAFGIVLLFALWLYNNRRQNKRSQLVPLFQLYICEYCQFPYLEEKAKPVTKCPKCTSLNKNNSYI